MIVEKIRNRNSAGKANEADKELPDKIYIDAAGLLSKYDPDPMNCARNTRDNLRPQLRRYVDQRTSTRSGAFLCGYHHVTGLNRASSLGGREARGMHRPSRVDHGARKAVLHCARTR